MNDSMSTEDLLNVLKQAFTSISQSLQPLNTKHNAQCKPEEVKLAVRSIIQPNEDLDSILDRAYITGCNLAILSMQVQVARNLFQNPIEYGRPVQASDQSDKEFKLQRDFKSMKSFLIATCVGSESPTKPALEKVKESILLVETQ